MLESTVQPVSQVPVLKEGQPTQQIEVSLQRGDLRVKFKVDSAQMVELGQVLREVLC
jgi:hypothetical protein